MELHEELKEWDQCLLMPGDGKFDEHGNVYGIKDNSAMYLDREDRKINISSTICFLRGKAYEALEGLTVDPFHPECTLVHLAAAMELGHSNELYLMACNLVKDYHQKALSWFTVGCYYYCIKKYDQSRRYFSKATSLDGTFPLVWIGFGNACAVREKGDQDMSAYRTAACLFLGCHLPTLYIGMEYMRTHNSKPAEQFIMQEKEICPSDPLVYNELRVVAYHMNEYNQAVWWFEKTLAIIPSPISEMWEPIRVNLAHAYRKLKKEEKKKNPKHANSKLQDPASPTVLILVRNRLV